MYRLAALILVLSATLVGCAGTAPPRDLNNACSILRHDSDWYEATKRTEDRWGIPIQVQLAIMHQESRFRSDARPGRETLLGVPLWRKSSAYGYAQVKDGTWQWYKDKTGRSFASRTDFADASDFIGWYSDVSQRMLKISKWDAYNQYLAYHEGHTGWKRKSYLKKAWLIKVARKVKARASTYGEQLRRCRSSLAKGDSGIPFF
ncbi:MAG: transglycosylase SLT domain-containing protein [Gammaproteobacteria bacterium]